MRIGCDLRERNAIERGRRIEQSKLEACRVEPFGGFCDEIFGDEPLAHRIGKGVEAWGPDTAREIGAGFKRERGRVLDVGGLLMPLEDVNDGAAIGDDEPLEAPRVAKVVFQQHFVRAGRPVVDGVVGAHHRPAHVPR